MRRSERGWAAGVALEVWLERSARDLSPSAAILVWVRFTEKKEFIKLEERAAVAWSERRRGVYEVANWKQTSVLGLEYPQLQIASRRVQCCVGAASCRLLVGTDLFPALPGVVWPTVSRKMDEQLCAVFASCGNPRRIPGGSHKPRKVGQPLLVFRPCPAQIYSIWIQVQALIEFP